MVWEFGQTCEAGGNGNIKNSKKTKYLQFVVDFCKRKLYIINKLVKKINILILRGAHDNLKSREAKEKKTEKEM